MFEQLLQRLNAIPSDKVAHFSGGVILFAAVQWWSVSLACLVVCAAAFGKEIYDRAHKDSHTPDVWDAAVTILGGVTGLLIATPHF